MADIFIGWIGFMVGVVTGFLLAVVLPRPQIGGYQPQRSRLNTNNPPRGVSAEPEHPP